jgi:hypothetical protein
MEATDVPVAIPISGLELLGGDEEDDEEEEAFDGARSDSVFV